jgi:hypothetical protein
MSINSDVRTRGLTGFCEEWKGFGSSFDGSGFDTSRSVPDALLRDQDEEGFEVLTPWRS